MVRERVRRTLEHFYRGALGYGGWPLAVSEDEAALINEEYGYILRVEKDGAFPDRPYRITRREGKLFKPKDVIELERGQRRKYQRLYNELVNQIKNKRNS